MTEFNLGGITLMQDDLKCSIINCVNTPELDEMERYAYVNVLKKAAEEAVETLAAAAIAHVTDEKSDCFEAAKGGKDFIHKGLTFRLTTKCEYNYNQGDELGKEWATQVALRESNAKANKALSKYIEGLEARIRVAHPRMVPTSVKRSVSFYNK